MYMKYGLPDVWKTYGEKRDDVRKTHPCIVSYEELPELEKEYDRNTSIETLKFIISERYNKNQRKLTIKLSISLVSINDFTSIYYGF